MEPGCEHGFRIKLFLCVAFVATETLVGNNTEIDMTKNELMLAFTACIIALWRSFVSPND